MLESGKTIFHKIFGGYAEEFIKNFSLQKTGQQEITQYAIYAQFYANKALSLKVRLLVTIASLVSQGKLVSLRQYIIGAVNVGNTLVEIAEVISQMGIYAGVSKSNEAMQVLNQIAAELNKNLADEYASIPEPMLQSGHDIIKRLFGEKKIEEVRDVLNNLCPDLIDLTMNYPFEHFYAREHLLDLKTRELITVASLATHNRLPQLALHIGAAHHIGCSIEQIEQVIIQMAAYAGYPAMLNAMTVLAEYRKNID